MPVWKNNILGFVPEADWLSIGFSPSRPNDPIDSLFGDIRTENLVAYWQSIASEYQIPVMAQFHGFDTEAQKTFRAPVDTHNIEKGLIKVKLNQSERMRALLRAGVRQDDLYGHVIQDGVRLADQVVTRSKAAKNELLATGELKIRENNLNLTVDYGVTADQTGLELDLSPEADIGGQIQAIVDKAADAGVTLTGFVTSRRNLTRMRQNAALQKAINGNVGAGALVSSAALTGYLETEFGLSRVVVQDQRYALPPELGEDGRPVIVSARYFPEDTVTFFAANPAGKLGVGAWGDPPEATAGALSTGSFQAGESPQSPYIYIDQWAEDDPKVLWTKASGLFMPILYNPGSLWIAKVKGGESGTLGTLTVSSAAGTASGTTKLTVTPAKISGNSYKYKTGDAASAVTFDQNVQSWTAWDGTADITATTGKVLTLVECDSTYKAKKSGSATVTAKA